MAEDSPRIENVKVVVRVRPISDSEKNAGYKCVVKVDSVRNGIGVCNQINSSTSSTSFNEMERTFHFDSVFGPESSQVGLSSYYTQILDSAVGIHSIFFFSFRWKFTTKLQDQLCKTFYKAIMV